MSAQSLQKLDLPAVVDLDSMDNVRDWLIGAFDEGDVELDGAQVERVATNSLLMLVSANETAAQYKVGFSLTNTSTAFDDAVNRLGLSDIFSTFRKGN